MQDAKKVTAEVPSYESFLAFYEQLQTIERCYSFAEIQRSVDDMFFTLVATQLDELPPLKLKITAEKLSFLGELFEVLGSLKPV